MRCADELWLRSFADQFRLDSNQLCWFSPYHTFLHYLQRVCCCRFFLFILVTHRKLIQVSEAAGINSAQLYYKNIWYSS